MSREKWLEHWRTVGKHEVANCLQCQARKKTKLANISRRDREQVYKDCGLTKVRGNLGGIYWE